MAEGASEIRAAISQDREELAQTVQSLVSKADVKGRVAGKVTDTADQVLGKAEELGDQLRHITPDQAVQAAEATVQHVRHRRFPYAVAGALVLGVVIGRRARRTPDVAVGDGS